MADKLAPFQIKARAGKVWVENTETGTKGPIHENSPNTRKLLNQAVARLNTAFALDTLGIL